MALRGPAKTEEGWTPDLTVPSGRRDPSADRRDDGTAVIKDTSIEDLQPATYTGQSLAQLGGKVLTEAQASLLMHDDGL